MAAPSRRATAPTAPAPSSPSPCRSRKRRLSLQWYLPHPPHPELGRKAAMSKDTARVSPVRGAAFVSSALLVLRHALRASSGRGGLEQPLKFHLSARGG